MQLNPRGKVPPAKETSFFFGAEKNIAFQVNYSWGSLLAFQKHASFPGLS